MEGVIGYRQTELACQKGLMMTTEQAFKVGLVDEVVTPDIVLEKAQNEMKSWLKIPGKYCYCTVLLLVHGT
jgi:3,2-trans-enoyl-CoA isomerase